MVADVATDVGCGEKSTADVDEEPAAVAEGKALTVDVFEEKTPEERLTAVAHVTLTAAEDETLAAVLDAKQTDAALDEKSLAAAVDEKTSAAAVDAKPSVPPFVAPAAVANAVGPTVPCVAAHQPLLSAAAEEKQQEIPSAGRQGRPRLDPLLNFFC